MRRSKKNFDLKIYIFNKIKQFKDDTKKIAICKTDNDCNNLEQSYLWNGSLF